MSLDTVKVLVVLMVLAGGIYLLAKSGSFSFYAYSVSHETAGQSHVHCYAGCNTDVVREAAAQTGGPLSPVAQDAVALTTTVQDGNYGRSAARLWRLLARTHSMTREAATALFWKQAPSLTANLNGEESAVLDRLRALSLRTRIGSGCRRAALRFVARMQTVTRRLAYDLAARPSWKAIHRFETSMRAAVASYRRAAQPSLAAASSKDRDQLLYALTRF
jgi:hypothetical protein